MKSCACASVAFLAENIACSTSSTGQRWTEIKESIDLMPLHLRGNFYSDFFIQTNKFVGLDERNYTRRTVNTLEFYTECSHIHCNETKFQR
jgi:hypothetical protein